MSFWACAQIGSNHQVLALRCLALEGFATYLPQVKVHRRFRRSARVEHRAPLFPGYLFISIVAQWHRINWTPGVIGLIMGGECPARVPDEVIDAIRARERNGVIELPKPPELRRGDRVRILQGPFVGHLAIYAGMSAKDRVFVLLELLGRQTRVELGFGDIASPATQR